MSKLTIRDLNLKDKKLLIRVDFNVPFQDGKFLTIIESFKPYLQSSTLLSMRLKLFYYLT